MNDPALSSAAGDDAEPAPAPAMTRLDDFLKRTGRVGTGGEAKLLIQAGEVLVNGIVETRRRKQLAVGDVVELFGESITVTAEV